MALFSLSPLGILITSRNIRSRRRVPSALKSKIKEINYAAKTGGHLFERRVYPDDPVPAGKK